MPLPDTAQSGYHLLKSARDVLRDNLESVVTALDAEDTVVGHTTPDPEDADIFVGRLRVPPQNTQWIALFNSSEFERLGLAVGASRMTYRLHVVSGVRSQTYRTDEGGAGVVKARTSEDAGWLCSHLLARACQTTLQRYMYTQSGIIQVKFVGRNQQSPRKNYPDVYEIESRYDIMLETHNAAFTS